MSNKREVLPAEIEVVFDYEVSIKNEKVKSLVIKKPKMKDILAREKMTGTLLETEVWILSALTGATVDDLKNLDTDQYKLLQDVWGKYVASDSKSI